MKIRSLVLFYIGLFSVMSATAVLLWAESAEAKAHYTPDYAQIDLKPILEKDKEELTAADYAVISSQTGLSRAGAEELYAGGVQGQLLELQQRFFAPVEYECRRCFSVCRGEKLMGQEECVNFLPAVQDGDILVTFSSHFLGWRSGHAGLVTDAGGGHTLEAIAVGYDSRICSLGHWSEYPCMALLRLKDATREERAEIAAYAAEELVDIPYDLTSLCVPDAGGTQCAHLVWLAYMHFGYDLDSDGGYIVTPLDLYRSDLLEVIQVYGLQPNH